MTTQLLDTHAFVSAVAEPLITQSAGIVASLGADELPVPAIRARHSRALLWSHRDLFDRRRLAVVW